MIRRNLLLVASLAALAACGETSTGDASSDTDMLALSREAVEVAAPAPAPSVGREDGLGQGLLADAVATAPAEVPAPIVEAAPVAVEELTLGYGETLAHVARWTELPVEDIAELSGLDLDGSYPVGTKVLVPAEIDLERMRSLRAEHAQKRVDAYLASRGGSVGTDFHKVRTGENAWTIAKSTNGIPLWLLASYNPEVNLDQLRPGQELMVPVLADVVVDAH